MILKKVNRRKLILSDGLILCNPTVDEISAIKDKLTFDNPAYKNALRYSRYNSVAIPPSLMYYSFHRHNGEYCIKMPIGFDLASVVDDYSHLKFVDERVYTQIDHAPFVLDLRDDQKEASDKYLYHKDQTPISSLIQLPTGKGKSILGLYLASKLSCKTLIVVHKDDLVDGWKDDIALAFDNKVHAGLIKAKSREVGHFLTIATVQTLNRLSQEELEKLYSTFGFVIQDECHHSPSTTFSIVANFRAKYRLGLTATPERSDGLDHILNLYFGNMCYKYEKKDDDGEDTDILPVKVIKQKSSVYFNPLFRNVGTEVHPKYALVDLYAPYGAHMQDNDIRLSDIPYSNRPTLNYQSVDNFVVNDRSYKEMVCHDIINEYDKGRSCIVFFSQKEQCRVYYDHLKYYVPEEDIGLYYGDNPDNKSVLEKAGSKRKFITLTTYAKATEGTNVKMWEVEFLVSSINNEKNTEQAVGRIRRAKEGKINPAILYDYRVPFVYSLANHGSTRDKRYNKLGFIIEGENLTKRHSIFKRGY